MNNDRLLVVFVALYLIVIAALLFKDAPRPVAPEVKTPVAKVETAPTLKKTSRPPPVRRPMTAASPAQRQTVKRNCGGQPIYYGFSQTGFRAVRTHNRSLPTCDSKRKKYRPFATDVPGHDRPRLPATPARFPARPRRLQRKSERHHARHQDRRARLRPLAFVAGRRSER